MRSPVQDHFQAGRIGEGGAVGLRRVGGLLAMGDQAAQVSRPESIRALTAAMSASRHSAATRMRASRMKAAGNAKDSGSL